MPWYTDTNGQKYYLPSIWVKEELPTFHEMWEFYQKKNFIYDPKIDTEMDHYWKIPEQLYRIVTMCNQFNKMLFEDGYNKRVIDALMNDEIYVKEHHDRMPIMDIRSYLIRTSKNPFDDKIHNVTLYNHKDVEPDKIPTIYTIPFANGKLNPFIRTANVTRVDARRLIDEEITLIIVAIFADENAVGVYHDTAEYKYDGPFEILMKEVREYYENGIGWKDENGQLITSTKTTYNRNTDSAL